MLKATWMCWVNSDEIIKISIYYEGDLRINPNKGKGKGKGHFYLTSVVPSVPTRLLSMEGDGAPSTPPATVSAPFYGYSKL